MRKYPTPEEVVFGKPFKASEIKALKKFSKSARLRLTYDPGEFPDIIIEYQAKPSKKWESIGHQSEMNFQCLPRGAAETFLQWVNDYYENEVDVEDSKIDSLWEKSE